MTTTQNALICSSAIGDAGTVLEASTSAASMSPENVLNQQPTDRWRSSSYTQANPAYLEIGLVADVEVNFVALVASNATSTAKVRHRLADSQGNLTGGEKYDSGGSGISAWYSNAAMETAAWDFSDWTRVHHFHSFDDSNYISGNHDFYRLDFWDDSNTDGFLDVGRLVLGLRFQPTINIAPGSQIPWVNEEKKRLVTSGGPKYPVARPREKKFSVQFQFLDEDELMENSGELNRTRGSSLDMVYIPDPTSKWAMHRFVYGVMDSTPPPTVPDFGIWMLSFSMEELL